MTEAEIEKLRAAYDAAEAAYATARDAYRDAYRAANAAQCIAHDAAVAADRVAVAAWDEYQSALKAKGGKP